MKPNAAEKRYFAYVDSLPCCHCKTTVGVTHHHPIGVGFGTMGGKAPHCLVMPLCGKCHALVHADGGQGWPQFVWTGNTLDRAFADGVIEYANIR